MIDPPDPELETIREGGPALPLLWPAFLLIGFAIAVALTR